MNRRDELRERYEDALFAFLMEDVIETEGKKMLEENERLKQDPLAAVPEAVDYGIRLRGLPVKTAGADPAFFP